MVSRLTCLALAVVLIAPVSAQLENVGNLSFPTSGSPAAQQHFLRAVAILHSFGWKQAIAEFKLAQKAQPDFAMAYWGETLCYNHPLNAEQDAKNPRAILARLGPNTEARLAKAPTAREKGFLAAVEARKLGFHGRIPVDDGDGFLQGGHSQNHDAGERAFAALAVERSGHHQQSFLGEAIQVRAVRLTELDRLRRGRGRPCRAAA